MIIFASYNAAIAGVPLVDYVRTHAPVGALGEAA